MNVLVPLAEGAEEIEAVIIVDVLRRAKWKVVVAGVEDSKTITMSRRVRLVPDVQWSEVRLEEYEALVLPGGAGGTERLRAHAEVLEALRCFHAAGRWVAAVCAGPLVLQEAGLLTGKRATCHPGVASQLTACRRLNERVVVDGRLITSQGPGTCFEFALKLIELVDGPVAARRVAEGLIL